MIDDRFLIDDKIIVVMKVTVFHGFPIRLCKEF